MPSNTLPVPHVNADYHRSFVLTRRMRFQRFISRILIAVLRLTGTNRFSNEFIQMLDPKVTVPFRNGQSLIFRTGHGRLLWRATAAEHLEPMVIHWLDEFTPSDVFYDIGANIGTYALLAAKRGIRSYAFEPELNNAQLLYENIFLNRVQNFCAPMPMALSDKSAQDIFFLKGISKGDALHNVGAPSRYLDSRRELPFKLQVLTFRLDDLVSLCGLPPPTKLKLDVDGNELRVLQGAPRALQSVQELCIELDEDVPEHRKARDLLLAGGFSVRAVEPIPSERASRMANCLFTRHR